MEDNNNQYENNTDNNVENKNICHENHCWKKCFAMLIAAFLGGFLATYFVTDQIMERSFKRHHPMPIAPRAIERHMYKDIDNMYKRDMKSFDDAFKKFDKNFEKNMNKLPKLKHNDLDMSLPGMDSVKIKSEFEDNKFKVSIGLKPFNNDENKINYNVQGRKLTVYGKSEVKDKDFEQDISFSQDFILPENADIMNISKVRDDNKLIISVPIK